MGWSMMITEELTIDSFLLLAFLIHSCFVHYSIASTYMAPQSIILSPSLAVGPSRPNDYIEASVHTMPKPLLREFNHVFGETYLEGLVGDDEKMELLAIPTNQKAKCDLVAVGDDVETEKDRLLNVVSNGYFVNEICAFSSLIHLLCSIAIPMILSS